MKLSRKILLAILAFVFVVIPSALTLAVQLPSVQTRLSQEIVRVVSDKLNGEISISNIYYALFGRIVIEDVTLLDNNRDTLINTQKVSLSFSPIELTKRHIKVDKVILTDGLINVIHTSDSTINILEVFPKQEKEKSIFNMAVSAKKLQLKNFKINYINPYGQEPLFPLTGHTMDFRDIHLSDVNLDIRDIRYSDLNGKATVAALSMQEARGYRVENLSFEASLNSLGAMIKNLNFKDSFSNVFLDHIYALTDDFSQIDNFLEDITLDAQISDKTFFDCRTVQALVPGIDYVDLQLLVKGDIFGTVKNIDLDNFKVYTPSKRSMVDFNAHLNGLPLLNETMASIKVKDCYTDFKDLDWILHHVSKYPVVGVAELAPGHVLSFRGSLNGLLDDFVAYGVIDSPELGSINIDAICRNEIDLGLEVLGMINTQGINVGEIIQSE
ncbi:MAG: hypothetical protein J6Z27_01745, partial [Bacteroidales bacterium]|nr:hypothetical protein [Bacteroidales bacterium]